MCLEPGWGNDGRPRGAGNFQLHGRCLGGWPSVSPSVKWMGWRATEGSSAHSSELGSGIGPLLLDGVND